MSEQRDQDDAESTSRNGETGAAAAPAAVVAPVEPSAGKAPARGSSGIAWFALLLVLLVALALAWLVLEQRRLDDSSAQRLQALEAAAGREQGDLSELDRRWQGQLQAAVEQMRAGSAEADGEAAKLGQAVATTQQQLEELRTELARYSASDPDDWLLAEAQYLLRLANQRLVMTGDVTAAATLLESADSILLKLDDVRLHEVRAALANELAALRAIPRVDVEGLYLRLSALIEQADELAIFKLPEREAQPQAASADNWRTRLRQGYEAALEKLSNYVVVRRRDVPMQALIDPQWEGLVRQNLRMLLEQAQVALLSGNQRLYRESLERAGHWVGEFMESDEAAASAMGREIRQLAQMPVATPLPDVSASVQALDLVMKQRLQQGGGQ